MSHVKQGLQALASEGKIVSEQPGCVYHDPSLFCLPGEQRSVSSCYHSTVSVPPSDFDLHINSQELDKMAHSSVLALTLSHTWCRSLSIKLFSK